MTTRRGKIARLPLAVREELNSRLRNGEPGKDLVLWLNSLPAVQEVLAAQFQGETHCRMQPFLRRAPAVMPIGFWEQMSPETRGLRCPANVTLLPGRRPPRRLHRQDGPPVLLPHARGTETPSPFLRRGGRGQTLARIKGEPGLFETLRGTSPKRPGGRRPKSAKPATNKTGRGHFAHPGKGKSHPAHSRQDPTDHISAGKTGSFLRAGRRRLERAAPAAPGRNGPPSHPPTQPPTRADFTCLHLIWLNLT